MQRSLFIVACLSLVSTAGVAGAQEDEPADAPPEGAPPAAAAAEPEPEPEPAGGKIDLRTEAPPPPEARSYHVHDGFYLRLGIGLGGIRTKYDLPIADATSSGGTLAFDLMIGGSPSKGLVIGGAALSEAGLSHKLKVDGDEIGEGNVRTGLLGPFIDGFFDPQGGWHAGGSIGLATLVVENIRGDDETTTLAGFGGAAWVGYDAWVGDEWSIGGYLRLGGAMTQKSEDSGDLKASTFSSQLLFTALYH